ncbi:MAG: penicillin-binding transpeptidase domain-containing protein, partial [Candidatus Sulfotelmatobacter sp.]
MSKPETRYLRLVVIVGGLLLVPAMWAAHVNPHALNTSKPKSTQKVSESQRTKRRMRHLASSRSTTGHGVGSQPRAASLTRTSVSTRRPTYRERFFMSSFAEGITGGDVTDGEDPVVRQAAIDALGNMNGTVVAIEPTSGRVLAMVNQKLALSSGAQPCSTIKLSVALAALSEGLISKETEVSLGGRSRMNLTEALARSNNAYFEALGRNLGFEKVAYYAHEYGLGELAGYDIPGEQLGTYPDVVISEKL